jgi:hypothetical protein
MQNYHVTTYEHKTGKTFIYSVSAENRSDAIGKILAGIESGNKRGNFVCYCTKNNGESDPITNAHN